MMKMMIFMVKREKKNIKNKSKKVDVTTVTEMEQYLHFGSEVRMIILMDKIWGNKCTRPGSKDRPFSVTFRILQLEITPSQKFASLREIFKQYTFIDDSELAEKDCENQFNEEDCEEQCDEEDCEELKIQFNEEDCEENN